MPSPIPAPPRDDAAALAAWRKQTRAQLLAAREALTSEQRQQNEQLICQRLGEICRERGEQCFGFYWPYRGEIDLRPVIGDLLKIGKQAALPQVIAKNAPLEFHRWTPTSTMIEGRYGIAVPVDEPTVVPGVLLIPLVGFDAQCYRLGYGGGFYDRTLAAIMPRPLTIGVGFEFARLATVAPQTHDIALDIILTETSLQQRAR